MFVYAAKTALDALPLAISTKNAEASDIDCNGATKTNGRSKKVTTKNVNGVGKKPESKISNGDEIRFPEHFPGHLKSFIEQDRALRKKEIETLEAEQVIYYLSYSNHLNTGLVRYSNGQKLSGLQMVWFSNGI